MNILNTEIAIRLCLAALFGGLIGLERERKDWAAGLRTHMMVCVGASLTMMVSVYGFSDVLGSKNMVLDPSRIAAQVISGIGFIGAGTILFLKQGVIRGLTTASGLWTVAAIGLATGGGMYFAAGMATVLSLIILLLLQPFERRFSALFSQRSMRVILKDINASGRLVNTIMQRTDIEVSHCNIEKTDNRVIVLLKFKGVKKDRLIAMMKELQSDTGIEEITWSN